MIEALSALSDAWPIVTGLALGIAGGSMWAAKMYSMQAAVIAKLDSMSTNLATHEHDDEGRVIIPAR